MFVNPSFSFEYLSHGKGNFVVDFVYFVQLFCMNKLYE